MNNNGNASQSQNQNQNQLGNVRGLEDIGKGSLNFDNQKSTPKDAAQNLTIKPLQGLVDG